MDKQSREELKRKLREKFEAHLDAMAEAVERFDGDPCAATFYSLEKDVNAALDRMGDEIAEETFRRKHDSGGFQDSCAESLKKNIIAGASPALCERAAGNGRPTSCARVKSISGVSFWQCWLVFRRENGLVIKIKPLVAPFFITFSGISGLLYKSQSKQRQWFNRMRRMLKERAPKVFMAGLAKSIGKNGNKKLAREKNYFISNAASINYRFFRRMGMPIGSGAIESAVRRVVNLRLKGAGMFWIKENAEGLLHLRCQLKSGNWDAFYKTTIENLAKPE